jgi:predicted HTH domain antitoxin
MLVEIPDCIAECLPEEPEQRARSILEGVVIGAYRSGMISRGRAFELLGLDYWAGDAFFRKRGVYLNYNLEEFKKDIGA